MTNKIPQLSSLVNKVSIEGVISILKDYNHINLFGDETALELRQILQINLDNELIDEIELIIVLSGE